MVSVGPRDPHKNIVVCSDGTGNSTIVGRGTNVFKIFEAVDQNGHRFDPDLCPQVAIYDDGVGTAGLRLSRLLAGAFGAGLRHNVLELYTQLCRIHDHGDRIYLFGFSRGAFTVRTLAGLIGHAGLLPPHDPTRSLDERVRDAYRGYRRRYRTALSVWLRARLPWWPRRAEPPRHPAPPRIHFIGVWDTVDAVGTPLRIAGLVNRTLYRFKFPDRVLRNVSFAYQALAVDDERLSFHPVLWAEPAGEPGTVLEQVWFPGAHSNVGGGYPKQGLSLVALDWMVTKARAAGLRLVESDVRSFEQHASVDDRLYDPREGAGMLYRWAPRDIAHMCAEHGVKVRVHSSVLERVAHGTDGYCPGNVPFDADVVFTQTGDPARDEAARVRARAAGQVLASLGRIDAPSDREHAATYPDLGIHAEPPGEVTPIEPLRAADLCRSLLDRVAQKVTARRRARLIGTLAIVWGVISMVRMDAPPALLSFSGTSIAAALAIVTAALWFGIRAQRAIASEFSRAWAQRHGMLRAALKRARGHAWHHRMSRTQRPSS